MFLPDEKERKGEGGFRIKGYFKHSYKKVVRDKEQGISEEEWWIVDRDDNPVEKVSLIGEE